MALVARFVVFNSHFAVVIDPQFPDNNIVNRRSHFTPGIVIFGAENGKMHLGV